MDPHATGQDVDIVGAPWPGVGHSDTFDGRRRAIGNVTNQLQIIRGDDQVSDVRSRRDVDRAATDGVDPIRDVVEGIVAPGVAVVAAGVAVAAVHPDLRGARHGLQNLTLDLDVVRAAGPTRESSITFLHAPEPVATLGDLR